jgi:hypothetical protein
MICEGTQGNLKATLLILFTEKRNRFSLSAVNYSLASSQCCSLHICHSINNGGISETSFSVHTLAAEYLIHIAARVVVVVVLSLPSEPLPQIKLK